MEAKNQPDIFIGTPTWAEIKNYLLRKREIDEDEEMETKSEGNVETGINSSDDELTDSFREFLNLQKKEMKPVEMKDDIAAVELPEDLSQWLKDENEQEQTERDLLNQMEQVQQELQFAMLQQEQAEQELHDGIMLKEQTEQELQEAKLLQLQAEQELEDEMMLKDQAEQKLQVAKLLQEQAEQELQDAVELADQDSLMEGPPIDETAGIKSTEKQDDAPAEASILIGTPKLHAFKKHLKRPLHHDSTVNFESSTEMSDSFNELIDQNKKKKLSKHKEVEDAD